MISDGDDDEGKKKVSCFDHSWKIFGTCGIKNNLSITDDPNTALVEKWRIFYVLHTLLMIAKIWCIYTHTMSHHFAETAKHLLSPSKGRMCEGKEPGGPEFALRK